jgi:hypothetical protein
MKIRTWNRAVSLLVAVTYLAGCAGLQNVPLGQSIVHPEVEVGESVIVTTKSGEKKSFTVTAVESDALVGANSRVSYTEMSRLDVKRGGMTPGKQGLLIGAAVLGVIAVAAAAGGGGGGSGGGY